MKRHLQILPSGRLKVAALSDSKNRFCLAIGAIFGLLSVEATAQVNVTATGGTATATYATVNDAFSAINAGTHQGAITLTVTANTTEPATPVPLLRSNTPSNYTSVLIKPSGNVTINSAAAPSANRGVIELAGADNVTIDGDDLLTPGTRNLSIVAATSSNAGIACIRLSSNSTSGADGADNNTVKNCIITGSRQGPTSTIVSYGIQFSNGTGTSSSSTGAYSSLNTLIENNQISKSHHGIYAYGASATYYNTGTRIINNNVGSATPADAVGYYGIYLSFSSAGTSGAAVIEGNDVQVGDPGTTGFSINVAGVYLGGGSHATIVRKNNIHDVANPSSGGWGAYGVQIASAVAGVTITNNFIRDITTTNYSSSISTTWQNYGIFINAAATGVRIIHNTIYLNKANATTGSGSNTVSAGIQISNSSATVSQLLNNIVINNQGTVSSSAYSLITAGTSNISGGDVNNNLYFVNGNGKIGYYNGTAQTTLANWQTATNKDLLTASEAVPFVSATDLHITAGATTLVESGGAPVSVTDINSDIDGQTRPGPSTLGFGTAPDIGADEFDGMVIYTCTTPAPGNTISSANNLCVGNSISLSFQNTIPGNGVRYQWQISTNNVTYTDINNAISTTYATTPSQAGWYRCKVKCLNGPDSAYSTPIQITFANNVTNFVNGVRCLPGTVNLTATGSPGTTLNWYTGMSGGAPVGSGNSFTTPVISSDTSYFVAAEQIAPGIVTIGSGGALSSNSGSSPFSQNWESNHSQYLILASELNAMGLAPGSITALSFNITTKSSTFPFSGYTVRIANTTLTTLTGLSGLPTFTTVYGPLAYTSVLGNNLFNFTNPFSWDGTSNLIIDICFDNDPTGAGTFWSSNDVVEATAYTYGPVAGRYADNNTLCGSLTNGTAVTNTLLPVIKFTGNTLCSSPRVQVTATIGTPLPFTVSNDTTVCSNATTALTVTTPTTNYNSVTWSPATNLFTNAAGTIPYVANTHANTVYVRNVNGGVQQYIVNATNTTTQCTASDTITVTSFPATGTAIATPGELCVSGTATLTLTPTMTIPGMGIQWQTSDNNTTFTNVSSAGNAASYTTPSITTTKYYRAVVSNGAVTCFNSTSDTVRVNNPVLSSSNGASRCGAGTLTLSATANTGSVVTWYSTATGGTVLATGTSYTTPSLTTTTNYWVSARSQNLSSCESPRVQVTATILPKPTASLTPTGIINICSGETQLLTAGGSTTGYTWLKNGIVDQPANNTSNFTVNSTGVYRVVVGNSSNCKDTSSTATVNVNVRPVVNLGNDTAYCGNVSYTLDAGNPGASYLWNDNSTASTLTVTNAGQYRVTVTNNFNCSRSDTVNIQLYAFPDVQLGNDTTICRTLPLTLNAGHPGHSYLWNTGSVNQTINVDQAGQYSVMVTNSNNCKDSDTINVSLMPLPTNLGFNFVPLFEIEPGKVRFLPVHMNAGYSYSWDFGDGQTSDLPVVEHVFSNTGTYTVSLNVNDGCSDSTEQLNIYVDRYTSVHKIDGNAIKMNIYPNPTSDLLNVEILSAEVKIQRVNIFNILGQNIESITTPDQPSKRSVYVGDLASGNYIIKIETNKGVHTRKFEILK